MVTYGWSIWPIRSEWNSGWGDQYAVAGARTDRGNYTTNFGLPLEDTGLQSQLDIYLEDAGPGGADPAALYTIWIGSNDIFTTLNFGGDMNLTVLHRHPEYRPGSGRPGKSWSPAHCGGQSA